MKGGKVMVAEQDRIIIALGMAWVVVSWIICFMLEYVFSPFNALMY